MKKNKEKNHEPKREEIKDYVVPSKKQPIFSFVKKILRIFIKAEVELHCDSVPDKAIIVTNHSAKMGPLALELYYPKFHITWGAHQMLGNYKSRFLYLRDVLYIQKLGKKKFPSTIKAAFEACFSKMIYKGMKILPSYTDGRFLYTIRSSIQALDAGISVMVFPEDSSEGYFDELTSAFAGFVALAEQYYNKTGEDVPVVPAYYHKKSKKIIIYPALSVKDLKAEGLNRYQIADKVKDIINSIYRTHFKEKN
ncbi:MAG: hypothetical protein IJY23_08990 [Clostridia bacterium]|nr:hypothetical protein [Clostridia bacterium]